MQTGQRPTYFLTGKGNKCPSVDQESRSPERRKENKGKKEKQERGDTFLCFRREKRIKVHTFFILVDYNLTGS